MKEMESRLEQVTYQVHTVEVGLTRLFASVDRVDATNNNILVLIDAFSRSLTTSTCPTPHTIAQCNRHKRLSYLVHTAPSSYTSRLTVCVAE